LRPVVEKTCSKGADVPGKHKNQEASTDNSRYFLSLILRQAQGQMNEPCGWLLPV